MSKSTNGRTAPTFEVVSVTPALATEWLDNNIGNRGIKQLKVAIYARDMNAGDWLLTGEPIKFDWDGRLIDGQNRLLAVIAANRSVSMLVARGLAPETQAVLDTGASRTAGDAMKMAGDTANPNSTAAAIRLALARESGMLTATNQQMPMYTISEIMHWYAKHPEIRDAVGEAKHVGAAIGATRSVLGYTMYATRVLDPEASNRFFDDLANLRTDGRGDPRFTLLTRLRRIRDEQEAVRAPQMLYYVFRAWNAWRAGERLHGMKVASSGTPAQIPTPR